MKAEGLYALSFDITFDVLGPTQLENEAFEVRWLLGGLKIINLHKNKTVLFIF